MRFVGEGAILCNVLHVPTKPSSTADCLVLASTVENRPIALRIPVTLTNVVIKPSSISCHLIYRVTVVFRPKFGTPRLCHSGSMPRRAPQIGDRYAACLVPVLPRDT